MKQLITAIACIAALSAAEATAQPTMQMGLYSGRNSVWLTAAGMRVWEATATAEQSLNVRRWYWPHSNDPVRQDADHNVTWTYQIIWSTSWRYIALTAAAANEMPGIIMQTWHVNNANQLTYDRRYPMSIVSQPLTVPPDSPLRELWTCTSVDARGRAIFEREPSVALEPTTWAKMKGLYR